MFSPGFVCGFVSLFVNKITQNLWMDFDEIFRICLKRSNEEMIYFGSDWDHSQNLLDP